MFIPDNPYHQLASSILVCQQNRLLSHKAGSCSKPTIRQRQHSDLGRRSSYGIIEAKVSVFDSAVQGRICRVGRDAVYNGASSPLMTMWNACMLPAHTLMFNGVPDKSFIRMAVMETLKANGMRDGAHIRMTLTRGERSPVVWTQAESEAVPSSY